MEHISEIIKEATVADGKHIATGLKFLDGVLGGYYPGELTTICGEEDCGKTAFVVSQLNSIAVEQHIPTLLVLNNMSRMTFLSCMAAYYCSFEHVNVHAIMDDKQYGDEVKAYLDILKDTPLYVIRKDTYEEDALTPEIEGMIHTLGIRIVFVDEAGSFWTCERHKSSPISIYKAMAMKWNIPIVITVCVWNNREGINGMKPVLRDVYLYCDIRGSDSVIGLFRYDRHDIHLDEHGRDLHEMVNMELLKCKGKMTKRIFILPWGYLYLRSYAAREINALKEIRDSGNSVDYLMDIMDLTIVDDDLPIL